MNFNLVAPCKNCPFRSDIRPFLRRQRVAELVRDIVQRDMTFACHKTVRGAAPEESHCAGALVLLEKLGRPNWRVRFAHSLGLYEPSKLKLDTPIFDTPEEMIEVQI